MIDSIARRGRNLQPGNGADYRDEGQSQLPIKASRSRGRIVSKAEET